MTKGKTLSFPNPFHWGMRGICGGRSASHSGCFTFGKELPYPLCTRLCGPQDRFGG